MSIGKALGWSLLLCAILGGMGTLIAYEPDFRGTPVVGLVTVWTLTIVIGVAGFWNGRRPNWLASLIVLFSLTTLFLAGAIHALGPSLSWWPWIALLVGLYLLAWVLPVLDPRLARSLSDEQLRPRTWLGRRLPLIVILLAVLGSVVLGLFGNRPVGQVQPAMLFLGTMSAMLAVGGGQTFASQIKEMREREIRARQEKED